MAPVNTLFALLCLFSFLFPSLAGPLPATLDRRYAGGMCSFKLKQHMKTKHYGWLALWIWDSESMVIGEIGDTNFDMKHSVPTIDVFSQLPDVLVITPEKNGEYIQFAIGADSWPSDDPTRCTTWQWERSRQWRVGRKQRDMNCTFVC